MYQPSHVATRVGLKLGLLLLRNMMQGNISKLRDSPRSHAHIVQAKKQPNSLTICFVSTQVYSSTPPMLIRTLEDTRLQLARSSGFIVGQGRHKSS